MPIYIESRDLAVPVFGGVAEHQYLVYIPDGEELNYDAWKYIGGFPTDGDGSLLTGTRTTDIRFSDASADEWTMDDFLQNRDQIGKVAAVAAELEVSFDDVTVSDMVDAGYAGSAGSAAEVRQRETVSTLNDVTTAGETRNDLWEFLVATANDISGQYTYKGIDLAGDSNREVFGPSANSNSFISSILRLAQDEGYDIGAFDTDANVPGNQTWLGTQGDDVLDGRIEFANGDEAGSLFGGDGADVLIGNNSGSLAFPFYLVAGKDRDVDTLWGGDGVNYFVGYYNQADLGSSDRFFGGAGNDTFFIVYEGDMLPGGIPDIGATLTGGNGAFLHDGSLGAGGMFSGGGVMSGGAGFDTLDYSFVNGPVTVRVAADTMSSIEKIVGTIFDDTFALAGSFADILSIIGRFDEGRGLDAGENLEDGDTLDISGLTDEDGFFVDLVNGLYTRPDPLGGGVISFDGFENVIGSDFDDVIRGDDQANYLVGGDGDDQLFGDTSDIPVGRGSMIARKYVCMGRNSEEYQT